MAHLPDGVHALFAQQHGVVATTQLHQWLDKAQIRSFEEGGSLVGYIRGVYRSPSWPIDELTKCAAVCLGRPYAAIAATTAGRLWNFRRLPHDLRVFVITPPGHKPVDAPWVVAYRTAAIRDDDIIQRDDGIRITSRARTALDLSRHVPPDDLLSIIEQAMHDGGLDESAMREVALDYRSPRRPWINTYLRQFGRRARGGPAESHPEVRVAVALEAAGVRGLDRQHRITLPGHGDARFDLAIPHMRWAIEIDVHPRHEETLGRFADRRRDDAALLVGWTTTRVCREDYYDAFDRTIAALVAEYTRRLSGSAV